MGLEEGLFLDPVISAEYKCAICTNISEFPITFPCKNGHVYCDLCCKSLDKCPQCAEDRRNTPIKPIDGQAKRVYNRLQLKCPKECEWQGTVGDLEGHYGNCPRVIVPCGNAGNGCEYSTMRHLLQDHMESVCEYRYVPCEHCKENVPLNELAMHHSRCPSFLLECEHGGEKCPKITRGGKGKHGDLCPFKVVPCEWRDFGCEHSCQRQYLPSHHADPSSVVSHLHRVSTVQAEHARNMPLLSAQLSRLETQLSSMKEENISMKAELLALKQFQHTAVFADFSKASNEIYSEPFEFNYFKWKLKIVPKGDQGGAGTHLSLYLSVLSPPEGFSLRVLSTYTVVAQNDPKLNYKSSSDVDEFTTEATGWGFPKFLEFSQLNNKEAGFLKYDRLIVKVTMEIA